MKRWLGVLRFGFGTTLGIIGFGLMGESLFPLRWGALAIGVLLLGIGLLLALGTISARPRPRQ